MTDEDLEKLPRGTHLWDKDYGCVIVLKTYSHDIVEVIKCSSGEATMTWVEDLMPLTPLLKELC
jgi:hypothetical protein